MLPEAATLLRPPPLMLTKRLDSDTTMEHPCEALKIIIRKKMTEKLEELSRNSQTPLSGGDKQKLLDSALTYLFDNIPKLALNTDNKTTTSEILSSLSLYPQLQEFTHKIVEERFYEEIKKINNNIDESLIQEISNGYKLGGVNPPISIPSYPSLYKSPSSLDPLVRNEEMKSDSSQPAIGSSHQTNLKDMIAQIINQKILSDSVSTDRLPPPNSSSSFVPLTVRCMDSPSLKSSVKFPPDDKPQQEQGKKRSKSPSASSGGKGSRPKRGKYRNYDRDNLLKAVQAVQSGEMSVHRAGSFYGVPHSTLEYKVKERHLNRGRNKKDAGTLSSVSLLKSGKENTSSSSSPASTAFTKDTSEISVKDFPAALETRSNDEISIISVQSPSSKKNKMSNEPEEPFSSLPIPPNLFLSNPFPFWNNSSSILAPFLSSPYQADQLYTSQMMSNFQRATKLNADSSPDSPSHEGKPSESFPEEPTSGPLEFFPNGGLSASPPASSPPSHEGFLNTLLQNKLKSQMREGGISWPMPAAAAFKPSSSEDAKEGRSPERESVGITAPSGLLNWKALLPSLIAARAPLASALSNESEPSSNRPCASPPATSLPLLKKASPIPVVSVGASFTEAP